jgi:phenylacetate-CoA ligase
MDLLAPIARYVIVPAWAAWERTPYLRHLRRLRRTQFDAPELIRRRQWERLSSLLEHAYRTTSFWRERFQAVGLMPQAIRSFDDFRSVPLLTKLDLRSRQTDLISDEYRGGRLYHKKTSGSTGISVAVVVDEYAQQFKRACVFRSDEWAGWRLGQPVAALWGNPEYRQRGWRGLLRNTLLDRVTFLDTLKMDEATLERFAAHLCRRPPALLFGHAHSLYLLAQFLRARGQTGIRPRGILSTSMVLHDWERRAIEEVFSRPVTNRYGCEEVSIIACQCERHGGLHINADGVYVEVLRLDGTPAAYGESGQIIVTDLVNRAMPMLRYQVGDMGALADQPCPCGRGLPLLDRIEGRVADYVVTTRGELVSGISLTENFNNLVPGVAQMQIVQEEIDRFVFRIVKDANFGPQSLEVIRSLVAERFGADVRYECEFVERIPQEPSGKYRFCISKVERHFS